MRHPETRSVVWDPRYEWIQVAARAYLQTTTAASTDWVTASTATTDTWTLPASTSAAIVANAWQPLSRYEWGMREVARATEAARRRAQMERSVARVYGNTWIDEATAFERLQTLTPTEQAAAETDERVNLELAAWAEGEGLEHVQGNVWAEPQYVAGLREQMRLANLERRMGQRAEDRERLHAAAERAIAEGELRQERLRIEGEARDAAEARARALLLSCLTPEQRASFERCRAFRVVSNLGNIFEIAHARTHGIHKLDMQGNQVEQWCTTPNGRIPICDVMLAQKLYLETDEAGLRQTANVWVMPGFRMVHTADRQWSPNAPPAYMH